MTQTIKERQRQMVRDEILDAAQSLVAQKGYGTVSMDVLAAHVGISKPTLYSYFPTKEELVLASVLREMKRLLAVFEEAGPDDESPLQRLEQHLRIMINIQVDSETLALRPLSPELSHIIGSNDEACAYIERMSAATEQLVNAGVARGEIDAHLDVPTVVHMFFSMAMSLKFHHPRENLSLDIPRAIETMVTMFRHAVRVVPNHIYDESVM